METGWSVAPGADGTDDWLALLDQYRVEFAALSTRRDSQRVELLRSHGDWEVQYREGDTVLLARVPCSGDGASASKAGDLGHPWRDRQLRCLRVGYVRDTNRQVGSQG